jgi:hypothetical protein
MSLFNIFRKKDPPKTAGSKTLLAMPMFLNNERYHLGTIVDNIKATWNVDVSRIEGDNDASVLVIGEHMVAIAFIPAPVPMSDMEAVAPFAYNWQTVMNDVKEMTGHAIVSIMNEHGSVTDRYAMLTRVLYSILAVSNAIGVYQGSQTMIIPKKQYLDSAEVLKHDACPVSLWVYIGLRKTEQGNNVYTHGLKMFGKQEVEVLDSALGMQELYNLAVNICTYVIISNITFKSVETFGYTADHKIRFSSSKGRFVEGESLKLDI